MAYRGRLSCGAAFAALVCASPAMAGDKGGAETLDDIVVSANRTETPIRQTGSSVTVITAEEIEKSQSLMVSDLISRIPGVVGMDYHGIGSGSYTAATMRGVSFDKVKILVDGVQVKYLSNFLVEDVDRIEIIKGNQSTLYGSDAMGGVIAVTTKSGKNSDRPIGGTAFAEVGSGHAHKTGANLYGRYDDVYYSLNVTQYDTDGFDMAGHTGGSSENDGYESISVDARIGADLVRDVGVLDKMAVEYTVRYMESDMEFDNTSTTAPPVDNPAFTAKNNPYAHRVTVKADMFDGLLSNELSGQYSLERWTHAQAGYTLRGGRETTAKYEYKGVLKPVDNHTVVFGADYEKLSALNSPSTVANLQRSQQGFYQNYQLEALDKSLTLTGGLRYDKADSIDGQMTYRFTLGYLFDQTGTRLHTSYGTGFKIPTASQLQGGYNKLSPEESRGYDLGVEQSFLDDRLVIDVTGFNTRAKDEIVYKGWNSTTGRSIYENVSTTRSFGLETSLTAEVSP